MISQPSVNGTRLNEEVWLKVPLAMECIVKVELIRRNHFKVSDNTRFYFHSYCIDFCRAKIKKPTLQGFLNQRTKDGGLF